MYFALYVAGIALFITSLVAYALYTTAAVPLWVSIPCSLLISYWTFRRLTRKDRLRKKLHSTPFPQKWRTILQDYVHFYRHLPDAQKPTFEKEIQVFIAEKRITGINTTITDTDKVLVAASAMIPVFGFSTWEYPNLTEVLLYPNSFNHDFETAGEDRSISGMVGNGFMNGKMILSKPDLYYGFKHPENKQHVGVHEFVHLLDMTDGAVDGIPEAFLDKQYVMPWIKMMHQEITKIARRESDIDLYGATHEREFFAVASEYFFQQPDQLKEKHPELYRMLNKVFRQDLASRFK